MQWRNIGRQCLLSLVICYCSAAAATFTFNPTNVTFTPANGVLIGSTNGSTLDFDTPGSPSPALGNFILTVVGQTIDIHLGTLSLNEAGNIQNGETDDLGLTIGFTLTGASPFSIAASGFTASDPLETATITFANDQNRTFFGGSLDGAQLNAAILFSDTTNSAKSNFAIFSASETNSTNNYEIWSRFTLVSTPTAVPEPGTYALMGAGLLSLGLLRKRMVR